MFGIAGERKDSSVSEDERAFESAAKRSFNVPVVRGRRVILRAPCQLHRIRGRNSRNDIQPVRSSSSLRQISDRVNATHRRYR